MRSKFEDYQRVAEERLTAERYRRVTAENRQLHAEAERSHMAQVLLIMENKIQEQLEVMYSLTEENRELRKNVAFLEKNREANKNNLTHLLWKTVFQLERFDRAVAAWRKTDTHRVAEFQRLQEDFPVWLVPTLQPETYELPPSRLDYRACERPISGEPSLTREMAEAIRIVDILCDGDTSLRERVVKFPEGTRVEAEEDSDVGDIRVLIPYPPTLRITR